MGLIKQTILGPIISRLQKLFLTLEQPILLPFSFLCHGFFWLPFWPPIIIHREEKLHSTNEAKKIWLHTFPTCGAAWWCWCFGLKTCSAGVVGAKEYVVGVTWCLDSLLMHVFRGRLSMCWSLNHCMVDLDMTEIVLEHLLQFLEKYMYFLMISYWLMLDDAGLSLM